MVNAWNRILAALALGAFAVGVANAADTSADEAAIRELKETLWPRAYFEQDTALLDRILAPEFQSVDDDGNWSTKVAELEWVAKNKPSYESLTFEIRRLDVFPNGTLWLVGDADVLLLGSTEPLDDRELVEGPRERHHQERGQPARVVLEVFEDRLRLVKDSRQGVERRERLRRVRREAVGRRAVRPASPRHGPRARAAPLPRACRRRDSGRRLPQCGRARSRTPPPS